MSDTLLLALKDAVSFFLFSFTVSYCRTEPVFTSVGVTDESPCKPEVPAVDCLLMFYMARAIAVSTVYGRLLLCSLSGTILTIFDFNL